VLPTDFQGWVDLLHQDFKRNHPGWEFPFNIVSLVPTAKELLPNKLLARFEDESASKKHKDEPPHKKKQDVRDIVVSRQTTKDVPVLFGVHSLSLVVKLSRSHLQMRALKRVLCCLHCTPTPHMRQAFGACAAVLHHPPQAVPANIELVSVIAWHTVFSQWNQMTQMLTNKLTPQKRAFIGAAPMISVLLDQLSHCTPSAAAVQCWVLNLAITQEIIMARLVLQHRVFGQSDGGQKGQEVRVLSLQNQETGKIVEHWSRLTHCEKRATKWPTE
jgi:hypothetical protein